MTFILLSLVVNVLVAGYMGLAWQSGEWGQ